MAEQPQNPDGERTRIKICGVRDAQTARVAAGAGADYVGVVFAEQSPRMVTVEQAGAIRAAAADAGAAAVAMFADQELELVREVLAAVPFEIVQLHGGEDRAFVEELSGVGVFKAVPCDSERIEAWRDAPAHVRALLIDTPTEPGEATGGTGRAFDWSRLESIDRGGLPPIMLAGGLTPENVAEALRTVSPWGVDVSSGVEVVRGVKGHALIRAFCEAVRGS